MDLLIYALIIITFLFSTFLSILNYRNRNAKIPSEVADVYEEDAYKKWLAYNMENFRLHLISETITVLFTLALLYFKVFPMFNDLAVTLTDSIHFQTIFFLGIYFAIDYVINIFFSYYRQFSIEERYGFNKSTKKTFVIDKIKGIILGIILGGGFIYGLSSLYALGEMFYLYAWISIILIILFINMFYVKIFVPIFNKLTPLEDGELKDKIIKFANKVGYEITKISVIDASKRTTKLNAFFSGFGKFKQVVLYDTLIQKMTNDQIVSVLAHEIGHNKHKHIIKNLLISIISISIYLGVLLFTITSDELALAFGFIGANFGFGIILFLILMSPINILFGAITNTISRKFEYEADRYAAVKGYQLEMIQALKILSRENFSNLTPHPLYVTFHYSHPPVIDRILAILSINR